MLHYFEKLIYSLFSIKDILHILLYCLMQHSISYSTALVQMPETVLSAPVDDIISVLCFALYKGC